jgi:excinuclease UvrABC ATPase subunit
LAVLLQKGFSRIVLNDEIRKVEDVLEDKSVENKEIEDEHKLLILIDRIVTNQEDETLSRMADSVQTAFLKEKAIVMWSLKTNASIFRTGLSSMELSLKNQHLTFSALTTLMALAQNAKDLAEF